MIYFLILVKRPLKHFSNAALILIYFIASILNKDVEPIATPKSYHQIRLLSDVRTTYKECRMVGHWSQWYDESFSIPNTFLNLLWRSHWDWTVSSKHFSQCRFYDRKYWAFPIYICVKSCSFKAICTTSIEKSMKFHFGKKIFAPFVCNLECIFAVLIKLEWLVWIFHNLSSNLFLKLLLRNKYLLLFL